MKNVTGRVSVLDLDELMQHVGADTALLSELFSIFQDYYPDQLSAIRDALAAGDCSEVREGAHQLKGAVSNFFATAAFEVAQELEDASRDNRLEDAKSLFERLEPEVLRMNEQLSELCSSK